MADLFTLNNLIALVTLAILEIVLGIDNVIFISILAGKLPAEQQNKARQTGLLLALITRVLLLLSLSFLSRLTVTLFEIHLPFLPEGELHVTARTIILLGGGLFLVYKATHEIHERLEGEHGEVSTRTAATFSSVITQIVLLDIVFSLDSVITAIGMANEISIMVTAVIIAVAVMLFAASPISTFVNNHPTVKMLALAFLLMIGMTLILESVEIAIPKGYVYFAMGFSVLVEVLNLRSSQKKAKAHVVHLNQPVALTSETN